MKGTDLKKFFGTLGFGILVILTVALASFLVLMLVLKII